LIWSPLLDSYLAPAQYHSALRMKLSPSILCVAALAFCSCNALAEKIVLVAGGAKDEVGLSALEAKLKEPFATGFDADGTMWILEMVSGNRLLKVGADGVLQHVAGTGKVGASGDGGPGLEAEFNGPHSLVVLPDGDVLIGDTWNGYVRKFSAKTGKVEALPGYKAAKGKEKGNGPYCIALNPEGSKLYIANLLQVHEVDLATGKDRVVAGNGKKGRPEDGAVAVDAPLVDPRAVAVDHQGQIYVLERGGNALRVVDKAGKIKTVVNASGAKGGTGDGGPALDATMNGPKHLCVDNDDTVIIADAESHLVRRYDPKTGLITRIAGTGKQGSAGVGGDPTQCQVSRPHGVIVHPATGELYITDSYNNRVLKIVK
jgi:DNA-binding beta-propeller fold protein YncE